MSDSDVLFMLRFAGAGRMFVNYETEEATNESIISVIYAALWVHRPFLHHLIVVGSGTVHSAY